MTVMGAPAAALSFFCAWLAFGAVIAANDADLTQVKELYFSAAYEEALAALDGLEITGSSSAQAMEASEYRMFCLLALDRRKEAEEIIKLIVTTNPFYRPADAQVSPRILAVFQDVRRSLLPTVLQRSYADAKAAYDRRDPQAVALFERVIALLAEPDVSQVPGSSDLLITAAGFRDLSQATAALASSAASKGAPVKERETSLPPAQPHWTGEPGPKLVSTQDAPPSSPVPATTKESAPTSSETGAIQAVLRRFQRAYTDLNAGAVKAVWPSVDEKTLRRAFDQLEQQDAVFDGCRIEVTGLRGVAACDGHSKYVPKVGSKTPQIVPRHWRFILEKAASEWTIKAVEFR